ncbi:MAG: polysaccharide pyruvyl transferase family protein [Verrucomicrobiae bacterium]|nr:polysaccharide pyruvyl transferase family protein [Verrucomicrobiae bacterium]
MKRILLLNDTSDHDNWGSQACAEALKRIIRETNPGIEIRPIPSEWIARRYYALKFTVAGRRLVFRHRSSRRLKAEAEAMPYTLAKVFVEDFLSRPVIGIPRVADEFDAAADQWLAGQGGQEARDFLDAARGVDAVVFNAEGSTYRNNYTASKALFLLWLAKSRLGLPALFVNGSAMITEVEPVLPGMLRKVFGLIDGVAVREPRSLETVRRGVPGARVRLIPDSVFYFDDAQIAELQRTEGKLEGAGATDFDAPVVCLSASMLPMDYRRDPARSSLYRLVEDLKGGGRRVVLLAKDNSDKFLRDLARRTGSGFIGPSYHYSDLFGVFSRSRLLVTGRYHHAIMATMVGCPVIALTTTSHKMSGLCDLFEGDMGECFDATDLFSCMESLRARASDLLGAGQSLRDRLIARAGAFRNETRQLGQLVASVL